MKDEGEWLHTTRWDIGKEFCPVTMLRHRMPRELSDVLSGLLVPAAVV